VVEVAEARPNARRQLVPPSRLCEIVGSPTRRAFTQAGLDALRILQEHGGLQPADRVLDVGCGCGRVALPLARYLSSGSYEGFDVVEELVQWNRERIMPRYANFRFLHADLYNDFYNPRGAGKASEYRFPYDADSFHLVLFNSVFTHLLYADGARYIAETARVLKPGGTALMTFFLLNEDTLLFAEATRAALRFPYRERGGVHIADRSRPCAAVAYPEARLRALLRKYGLAVQEPIRYGCWSGREAALAYQDVVVVRNTGRGARSFFSRLWAWKQ
jgi:SAM-dependent methyltransferase